MVIEHHLDLLSKETGFDSLKDLVRYITPEIVESRRKQAYKGFRTYNTDYISVTGKDHNQYYFAVNLNLMRYQNSDMYADCLRAFDSPECDLQAAISEFCNNSIIEGLL